MAVNTPLRLFSEGSANKMAVYRVNNITAADTITVANDFVNVASAYFWPATGAVAAALAPVSSNTTLTPAGALAKDDGYLAVYGTSS